MHVLFFMFIAFILGGGIRLTEIDLTREQISEEHLYSLALVDPPVSLQTPCTHTS